MPLQTTYSQFQAYGFPGMAMNMEEWNGMTRTATAAIIYGAPVQRNGRTGCAPLVTGGEFLGIAKAMHLSTGNTPADSYAIGDNVPVCDEGVYMGLSDAAIAAGAALRWNTATLRWTTAAASGTVIDAPGVEADEAASGAAVLFKIRVRRVPS